MEFTANSRFGFACSLCQRIFCTRRPSSAVTARTNTSGFRATGITSTGSFAADAHPSNPGDGRQSGRWPTPRRSGRPATRTGAEGAELRDVRPHRCYTESAQTRLVHVVATALRRSCSLVVCQARVRSWPMNGGDPDHVGEHASGREYYWCKSDFVSLIAVSRSSGACPSRNRYQNRP